MQFSDLATAGGRHAALTSSRLAILLLSCLATPAPAQVQARDVIYMKADGTAFTMDVLTPARPNGAAVIFVVSGGWISDHTMLERYGPELQRNFADSGFTVFEVVHGAQPRFKVAEIVEQVRTAVRFVRAHADDYGIDTNRIGVSGISTGGHLALMVAGSPDSPVSAVAAISPPADLANWGKPGVVFTDVPQLVMFTSALGLDAATPRNDVVSLAERLSPITLVDGRFPPTLIVHGDSDAVVPVQQARAMDQALARAGVEHRLEVIAGGGHDDSTFGPGLAKAFAWFRDRLAREQQ